MESDEGDDSNGPETVVISGRYDYDVIPGTAIVNASKLFDESAETSRHGLASHNIPRTKYYKQTYRPAWENMPDFKGWLQGVVGQPTRAYCIYCQKTLHAHRLSLLKHTCTMRHQKAAQMHQAGLLQELNETEGTFEILIQHSDNDGEVNGEDQVMEDENIEAEDQEQEQEVEEEEAEAEEEEDEEEEEEEEEVVQEVAMPTEIRKIQNSSLPPPISTQVIDNTRGMAVQGLQVSLYKLIEGRWTYINEGSTNIEGRFSNFFDGANFTKGRYKLHYDVDRYFEAKQQETIYPFIEIVFNATSNLEQFNIPLMISPFGYSTFRGTH